MTNETTPRTKALRRTVFLLRNEVWKLEEKESLLTLAMPPNALMQTVRDAKRETQRQLDRWADELFETTSAE